MFDKHADEAIEAEIWVKSRNHERENIALDMLADNEPIEKIVKYSHLPESKVLELKKSQMEKVLK